MVGIIGPNGAGKSTLLKTLIGYLEFTQGQVLLQGHSIKVLKAKERANHVSYLSQEATEAFPFPVADVVAMGLYAKQLGSSHQTVLEQVDSVLERLQLLNLKSRRFNQLSGGEKQRVAIARAMINDPLIIMCDEPTGNLDNKNANIVFTIFKELTDTYNKTLLVVTHDLAFAEKTGRIIELEDGKIVGFDTEVVSLVLDNLGVRYRLVIAEWNEVLKKGRSGEADLILGASYVRDRENFFYY